MGMLRWEPFSRPDNRELEIFIPEDEAKLALRRHLKRFNTETVEVQGIPIALQVAGVATNFDPDQTPNAAAFVPVVLVPLVVIKPAIADCELVFVATGSLMKSTLIPLPTDASEYRVTQLIPFWLLANALP